MNFISAVFSGSDEADETSAASKEASEKAIHEPDKDDVSVVDFGKRVCETEREQTSVSDSTAKEETNDNNEADIKLLDIVVNGDTNPETQCDGQREQVKPTQCGASNSENESRESNQQLTDDPLGSGNVKTECIVTDEHHEETPPEANMSEKEVQNGSRSSTGVSDLVDAEALNGIEMEPNHLAEASGGGKQGKVEETTKTDVPESQTPSVPEDAPSQNVSLSSDVDSENQNGENCNGELDEDDPELQLVTSGSEEDLRAPSTEAVAESCTCEAPGSSEGSPSTASDCRNDVITTQPTASGKSETDSAPAPVAPRKKDKKKAVSKGLTTASLGACFPVNCAGNASPTFNLSRGESVYGGSVRSRLEAAHRRCKNVRKFAYDKENNKC